MLACPCRPWLVLVPNFVYMKDFFQPILSGLSQIGESGDPKKKGDRNSRTEIIQKSLRRARSEVAFLTPARRYVYDNKVATKTSEVKVSIYLCVCVCVCVCVCT